MRRYLLNTKPAQDFNNNGNGIRQRAISLKRIEEDYGGLF